MIMKSRYGILIFCFSLMMVLLINDKGIAMAGRPYAYYREKLKEVNISDGVSEDEAIIIAQNYVIDGIEKGEDFYKKLGISKAKISEDHWDIEHFPDDWVVLFPMRYGIFKTWSTYYVNKHTGKVVGGGPIK